MLYIFAGFPQNGLHAGGLQYAIETVEELAFLEHASSVHYRKEGVFTGDNPEAEWLYPVDYRMSDLCLQDGITWAWFPEKWQFGNGVTVHKTVATYETKQVTHGSGTIYEKSEGWHTYEARYSLVICPQEDHIVHLTWLVTKHRLPEFAYNRIRDLIEYGAEPKDRHLYSSEAGRHFTEIRWWDGTPTFHGGNYAIPQHP